jgi:hypothetical protein
LGDKGVTDETKAVAEQAKKAFAVGRVELAQRLRKDGDGKRNGYDYLAVKKCEVRVPIGRCASLGRERVLWLSVLRRAEKRPHLDPDLCEGGFAIWPPRNKLSGMPF